LRAVFYGMPMAADADEAEKELASWPAGSLLQRCGTEIAAELLAKGRRYSDAATEYRSLIGDAHSARSAGLEVALRAPCAGRSPREAKQALDALSDATGEVAAQKLYNLGEIARARR